MEIDDIVFDVPVQSQLTYFKSYMGEKDGCTFRADVLTAPVDTDAKVQAFHDYCTFLEEMQYVPGFQPLYKGFIRESDHVGVLVWRHHPDLLHLRDPHALELLSDRNNKTKFFSCVTSRLFSYYYESNVCDLMDSSEGGVCSFVGPSLDSMLVDRDLMFPVFTRYGIQPLLAAVFGEQGNLCPLYSLPEMNYRSPCTSELAQKMDKYMLGVLMYEVINGVVLSRDKNILDQVRTESDGDDTRLVFENTSDCIFLRKITESLVTVDAVDRQFNGFEALKLSFISILQEDITVPCVVEYCRKAFSNGDESAEDFLDVPLDRNFTDLQCIEPRNYETGKPICTSMIIGGKVVHDNETIHAFFDSLGRRNRPVIFILVIGEYQIGKTTLLSLITGNKHYITGTGSGETTRGVSILEPIPLNSLDETFRNLTGVPENVREMYMSQGVFRDEGLKAANPDVVFVDIEGLGGTTNGLDRATNDQVFRQLVDPYIAICNTMLFMLDPNVQLSTLDFVLDTLSIISMADQQFNNTFAINLVFRDVSYVEDVLTTRPFNNPFDQDLQRSAREMLMKKMIDVLRKKLGNVSRHSPPSGNGGEVATFADRCFLSIYPLATFSSGLQFGASMSERSELFDMSVFAMMRDMLTNIHMRKDRNNRIMDCDTVLAVFDRVAERSLPSLEAFRLHQELALTALCDNISAAVLDILDAYLRDENVEYFLDDHNYSEMRRRWASTATRMLEGEISSRNLRDDFNFVVRLRAKISSDVSQHILMVVARVLDRGFNEALQALRVAVDGIKADINRNLQPPDIHHPEERWPYWIENSTRDFVAGLDLSRVSSIIEKMSDDVRKSAMMSTLDRFLEQSRDEIREIFNASDETLKQLVTEEDIPDAGVQYKGFFHAEKLVWKLRTFQHPSGRESQTNVQVWEASKEVKILNVAGVGALLLRVLMALAGA